MSLARPIVCVITRARGVQGSPERATLVERLRSAALGGATMIQVRERLLDDRALAQFVRELVAATRDTACRVIVNDRTDIAIAAGAAGVHLKERSVMPRDVRRIVPHPFLVGRSVHTQEDAAVTEREGGCDYLFFGTVFPTASKPDQHPVAGVDALRAVCAHVSLPVVAIGGVTVGRAREIGAAGAAGAAAISLFTDAGDLPATVAAMRHALTPQLGTV